MLLRMYVRWAEQHGYKVEWLEESGGEEAGLKSATIEIKGAERLWLAEDRNPACIAWCASRRSIPMRGAIPASRSVWVYPVVDDDIEIEILDKDLQVDTYRASGAGGQHINKTDSAIRITHIPTGIVVTCQADRSQHRNRAMAMEMLKARLYEAELQQARRGVGGDRGAEDRHRLGPPDPLLRAAALPDGEGSPHRRRNQRHPGRARRRHRPLPVGGAGLEDRRRAWRHDRALRTHVRPRQIRRQRL